MFERQPAFAWLMCQEPRGLTPRDGLAPGLAGLYDPVTRARSLLEVVSPRARASSPEASVFPPVTRG
jgi:hypothetical protein